MEDLKQLTILAGPKMIPFLKAVAIYFLVISYNLNLIWSTILKCAPILCLMAFVFLNGTKLNKEHYYSHKILMGLIFSCVGDLLLNIDMFPHGMAAFGVAQLFYIFAFGFRKRTPWIGIILYIIGLTTILVIRNNIKSSVLLIGLPIYGVLVLTMCWRSIDRAIFTGKNASKLINILSAIGSILFVFSDAMIAIDKFYTPLYYRTFLVMATYYAAQLAITLSTIDVKNKTVVQNQPKYKDN